MAIWEEGSGPTTGWDQEAGMAGNANQENVATLASKATQAASNAEDSEDAAALSATAAAGSATAAAGSATLAGQHKTAAETAQGLSEAAQGLSEGARDAALGYSNTASGHATTATTQAGIATTQASTATTQAGIATTQAGIATTKAGEAATSASNAAASETNAGTSETNAATSETNAATSESNAATSETNAATSASNAAGSESAAATSEANAAASESAAASSETNAATSETNAATSASNAATSESNASSSASAAATSEANAAASYDNFDDRYLGSKANDPTVDNDGDALLTGALYFNSTTDVMKVYDGSSWVAAYASIAGITLDNVTTDGNTTTNAITVGGMTSTGPVILNADPSSNLGAATKQYVDTIAAAGVHYHDPVRVEKEGNLAATYDNGSSGVGATLTNSGTQEALVIDGVTLLSGDRVLIYEQTNQAHNGIYTVTDVGSGSTNWVLTRAVDADSYAPSDPDSFGQGDAFYVQEGTMGAGETYVMTTEGPITFGTTNIHFSQISSAQVYSGSTGIDITGTTISSTATLADVTTAGNSTTNSITVGDVTSTGNVTASNLNTTDWDAAYGWGDHSAAGYLTSYVDTNNYVNSVGFTTSTGVLTLNREGLSALTVNLDGRYLTSYTETDTLDSVTGRGATTTNAITVGGLTVDTNTLVVDAANNRVGVGTNTPDDALVVNGGNAGLTTGSIKELARIGDGRASNANDGLRFSAVRDTTASSGGDWGTQTLRLERNIDNVASQSGIDFSPSLLKLRTGSTEKMRIDSNGKVGINTTALYEQLNVVGNTQVLGSHAASATESTTGAYDFASGPSYAGVIARYDGPSSTGTYFGLPRSNLGSLRFQNTAYGLVGTNGSAPLVFATLGTERMRIDSSGNLGIGGTSAGEKLEVYGNIQAKGASTETRFIDVGAGRTGNGYAFLDLVGDTTYTDYGLRIIRNSSGANTTSAIQHRGTGDFEVRTEESADIRFVTSATERMRIDSSGNVGIGTGSPSERLEVSGIVKADAGVVLNNTNEHYLYSIEAGRLGLRLNDGATATGYMWFKTFASGVNGLGVSSGALAFGTALTERMRIDSSGNLLVGTTSEIVSARGPLQTNTLNSMGLNIASTSNNGGQAGWSCRANNGDSSNYAMFYNPSISDNATYVGFWNGVDNSTRLMSVRGGTVYISTSSSSVGNTTGQVVGTQTSDERLKDIEPDFNYGLDSVMALSPIAYKLKGDDVRKLGFGAQTTRAIIPEAVYDTDECLDGYDVDPNDPMKQTPKSDATQLAMEYVQLIPVLTKAMQEQQAMIEELKAEVAALKGA